jgi:hypothetical protein
MNAQTAQMEFDNLIRLNNFVAAEDVDTLVADLNLTIVQIYSPSLMGAVDSDGDTWLIGCDEFRVNAVAVLYEEA